MNLRPRPSHRRRGLWIVLAFACAVSPAISRVFWQRGSGGHGAVSAGQPGWSRAYAAPLRINGGRADLEILGADLRADDAHRMLIETYRGMGGSVLSGHGAELGWGVALIGDRVVRWLIFGAGLRGECVVMRIDQTRADFAASVRRPDRSLLDDLPDLPGAEPGLFAADDHALAAAEISSVRMPPAVAVARLESMLVGEGWTPAIPMDPGSGASIIYQRGRDLCVVSATATPGGASVIRLRKTLGGRDGI